MSQAQIAAGVPSCHVPVASIETGRNSSRRAPSSSAAAPEAGNNMRPVSPRGLTCDATDIPCVSAVAAHDAKWEFRAIMRRRHLRLAASANIHRIFASSARDFCLTSGMGIIFARNGSRNEAIRLRQRSAVLFDCGEWWPTRVKPVAGRGRRATPSIALVDVQASISIIAVKSSDVYCSGISACGLHGLNHPGNERGDIINAPASVILHGRHLQCCVSRSR